LLNSHNHLATDNAQKKCYRSFAAASELFVGLEA
jgi:hypothetical protein